jgi:O-antigen/teichoic acid export membrane protein
MNISQIKKFTKSEFFKNVAVLFSGSTLAQAIPILISPILSRIYLPEDFGEQSLFVSTYTVLTILACLRYDVAIMLPKHESEARQLFVSTISFSFIFSLVILLVIGIFHSQILNIFNLPGTAYWLYLVPISIFLKNFIQSSIYYQNRKKNFKTVAKSKVFQTLSTSFVTLGAGLLWSPGSIGLIGGKISGLLQNFSYFSIIQFKELARQENYSLKRIKALLIRYKYFPYFSVANGFLNLLSIQIPTFLLISLYDSSIAGYYAFSYRIILTPVSLIAQSIKEVYFQKITEFKNEGKPLHPILVKSYLNLIKVSIIPFLIAFIFAPEVFNIIFGKQWQISGEYARAVMPWLFLVFINTPMSTLPSVLNKQNVLLVYNILLLVFRFLSLYLGYIIYNDAYFSIILFSSIGFIFNLVFMVIIFVIVKDVNR